MLSRRVIQLMSCDDMAGIESLYFQLSDEIASKSNMEWKFPTGGNIYDTMAECLLPDDVPQTLRAIIRSGYLSLTTCSTTNNTRQRKTNDFPKLKENYFSID